MVACVDSSMSGKPSSLAAWLAEQGYSPRTVTLYTQLVRRAEAFLLPLEVDLAEATADDLLDFWRSVPATRSSRSGIRYALIAYYRWLTGSARPASDLPSLPAPHRLPRPVGEQDYDRLLDAARDLGGHHKVLGELLYFTACRIGEAKIAAWHQFDLGGDPAVWYIAGKGSKRRGPKQRQIPLNESLASTLRVWRAANSNTAFVFASDRSNTGHRHVSTLQHWVAEIGEHAGVTGATPHRWRHSTATLALERTNDLRAVQDFLGHSSLASTQIYTFVTAGRLESITTAMHR